MKRFLMAVVLVLALAAPSWAAGTVVWADPIGVPWSGGTIHQWTVTATITADSSGNVTAAPTSMNFDGVIVGVQSNPGSPAPTASWAFTLTDVAGGADLLNGGGAGRSATVTQAVLNAAGDPVLCFPVNGYPAVAATGMGSGGVAVIRATIRE